MEFGLNRRCETKMGRTTPIQFTVRFIVGASVFIVLIALLGPALSRAAKAPNCDTCVSHLKAMGLVFKMYASETNGAILPPIGPYGRLWVPELSAVYPDYVTDLKILTCPGNDPTLVIQEPIKPTAMTTDEELRIARTVSMSYTYTCWQFRSNADIAAVLAARDNDTSFEDVSGVPRLRDPDGVRADSTVPTLFDTVTPTIHRHDHVGANVLYLDGHVAFVKQGERFPVLPATQAIFAPE